MRRKEADRMKRGRKGGGRGGEWEETEGEEVRWMRRGE